MRLEDAVVRCASLTPDALAVEGPDGFLTYGELDRTAHRIAIHLRACGVRRGHRVAIWLEKSVLAVAGMQAVLRCGAAYIPIDTLSPPERCRVLMENGAVAALISRRCQAVDVLTGTLQGLPCLCVEDQERWRGVADEEPLPDVAGSEDDLAYILYTSGSTGTPKGVAISHRNALAFTLWAQNELSARPEDRFTNHAPFHFDLSVLDLYVAFQAGASVHLIPDTMSLSAARLVSFVAQVRPTVWYSVPSALILMMEHGGFLDLPDLSLRAILFAGEPFPVKHLRRLRERWPDVRLLNLYGPTETNVCTFHEVGELPSDQTVVPIGRACSGNEVWAQREDGRLAEPGEIGELLVAGPTVMQGYWGHELQRGRPYATGDLVRVLDDGDSFEFVGRRDHQVKVRGHRVEIGEIESVLQDHPAIREAVVVVTGSGLEARLTAFLVSGSGKPPLLAIKQHCAGRLPRYMIIDRVCWVDELPRTRTGKTDRLQLVRVAAEGSARGATWS